MVAAFTGAWIEMSTMAKSCSTQVGVAPFTGAWIEIDPTEFATVPRPKSHPSRVRGLKCLGIFERRRLVEGRTLHGCVD